VEFYSLFFLKKLAFFYCKREKEKKKRKTKRETIFFCVWLCILRNVFISFSPCLAISCCVWFRGAAPYYLNGLISNRATENQPSICDILASKYQCCCAFEVKKNKQAWLNAIRRSCITGRRATTVLSFFLFSTVFYPCTEIRFIDIQLLNISTPNSSPLHQRKTSAIFYEYEWILRFFVTFRVFAFNAAAIIIIVVVTTTFYTYRLKGEPPGLPRR